MSDYFKPYTQTLEFKPIGVSKDGVLLQREIKKRVQNREVGDKMKLKSKSQFKVAGYIDMFLQYTDNITSFSDMDEEEKGAVIAFIKRWCEDKEKGLG